MARPLSVRKAAERVVTAWNEWDAGAGEGEGIAELKDSIAALAAALGWELEGEDG